MSHSAPAGARFTDWRERAASNPLVIDGLIALGLTLFSLLSVAGRTPDIGNRDPLSVSLLMVQTLPLVLRRRYPLGVLVVVTIATVGHGLLSTSPTINSSLGGLVAVYTVADLCDRRLSAAALVGVGVSVGGLIVAKGGIPGGLPSLFQSELVIVIVWLLGSWSQERRKYLGIVEQRAALAERERQAGAERAVADERSRIAREMHDVVAHHVSVIVIQAGAALRSIDRRPEQARDALVAIDDNGRRALADMRRMVGVLGGGDRGSSPGDRADLAPMPGMDRLGELIEQVRAAGMPVELSVAGEPRPLDPGIELAAYRIIQEALTNSLKHASGGRTRVNLRYEQAALEVAIQDEGGRRDDDGRSRDELGDGEPRLPAGPGHGLIGMRERVAMFGGRLEAGPTAKGFRVAALLPLDAQPATGG